jgi:hypothetical protein
MTAGGVTYTRMAHGRETLSVVGPVEMMRSTIATICPGCTPPLPPRLAPELMNDQAGLPNPRFPLTKSGSTYQYLHRRS